MDCLQKSPTDENVGRLQTSKFSVLIICVILDPLSFNVNTVQEYFLAAKNTISCYCTVPISEMDCLHKSSAIENVGPSHPSKFNASFIFV